MSDHDVPQAEVDKIHEAELRSYGFEPVPSGDKPRWTVDEDGQNPRFGKLTFSLSGNGTNQDRVAAWDALVALVRGANEIEALRARLEAAEAVIRHFIDHPGLCLLRDENGWWWANNPDYDPDAYLVSDAQAEAIARARGETT